MYGDFMIPKIIHYCWFGKNPLPELAQKCIASWKKFCPDYEIVEWNESNFDINQNRYMADAYKEKKWSFVSDYSRLKVVYENGGIYLDTDVEVIKSLDSILTYKAVLGFESKTMVNGGNIIAAEKGNSIIKEMFEIYDGVSFYNEDGSLNLLPSPKYNTEVLQKHGLVPNNTLQTVGGVTVFPNEYFCPKDFETGVITLTANTYTIHHFDASWHTEREKKMYAFRHRVSARFGNSGMAKILFRIYAVYDKFKYDGFQKTFMHYFRKYVLRKK